MAFLKKSLAEDSIDRYSHTWTFLFFLLLSIICLFVSLSPSMTLISYESDGNNHDGTFAKTGLVYPTYKAFCWCPAEFTYVYVVYANTICATELNSIIKGKNFTGASIYHLLPDVIPITPIDRLQPLQRVEDLRQNVPSSGASENQKDAESSEDKGQKDLQTKMEFIQNEKEEVRSRIQDLISYKTPLCLFLLAICLRLPHAIWSILSMCCGCINIDQTLATVQTAQSMDFASQQRIKREIVLIIGKSSEKSSALLYLLMKLLTIVVVCLEVVTVGHGMLGEYDRLENDAASLNMHVEDVASFYQDLPDNNVYICEFEIMQLQNIQSFTIQCVFNMEANDSMAVGDFPSRYDESSSKQPTEYMTQKRILLLYKALFTIVLATLVILAFCNISSLLVWLFKLVLSSCRQSLGLKTNASLDIVFFVSMAWCNTSAIIAMDLAKSCAGSDGGSRDDQMESLRLKEDTAVDS